MPTGYAYRTHGVIGGLVAVLGGIAAPCLTHGFSPRC